MKNIIFLRNALLALLCQTSFTLLRGAVTNPYQVKIKSENLGGIKKDQSVKITFTFEHSGKELTVKEVVALSDSYTKEVEGMFVNFTREIKKQTEKYALWDGFSLEASLSNDTNIFTYVMNGKCQPEKKDPKKRTDVFMAYKGDSKGRYQEIRKKQPSNTSFKHAFDEHLCAVDKKNKTAKTIVFTSPSGGNIIIIPRKGVTSLYDLGDQGIDEECGSYWKTTLAIWKKYKGCINTSRFNTGNTNAAQTVPHAHGRNELNSALPQKRKVIAWDDGSQVVFKVLAPGPGFASYLDDDPDSGSPLWQDPKVVIGVIVGLGLLGWLYMDADGEVKADKPKKKRKKSKL